MLNKLGQNQDSNATISHERHGEPGVSHINFAYCTVKTVQYANIMWEIPGSRSCTHCFAIFSWCHAPGIHGDSMQIVDKQDRSTVSSQHYLYSLHMVYDQLYTGICFNLYHARYYLLKYPFRWCPLEWIFQQTMMIEPCFNSSNTLPMRMNLSVASEYTLPAVKKVAS